MQTGRERRRLRGTSRSGRREAPSRCGEVPVLPGTGSRGFPEAAKGGGAPHFELSILPSVGYDIYIEETTPADWNSGRKNA